MRTTIEQRVVQYALLPVKAVSHFGFHLGAATESLRGSGASGGPPKPRGPGKIYFTRPFAARELLARVEAHIKLARLGREGEKRVAEDLEVMRRLQEVGTRGARNGNDFQQNVARNRRDGDAEIRTHARASASWECPPAPPV
jgi:hypothetical protein